MTPDPATVDRVRVPSWPDAWLRICASFGLAGWLLVSCIVPAIFALWTATNLERALRTVVVIGGPFLLAALLRMGRSADSVKLA